MFNVIKTPIPGLIKLKLSPFTDARGMYKKYFEKEAFKTLGVVDEFTEASVITSNRYALRGLHYQVNNSQGKLIQVIQGEIFDVALDLRSNSSTFGKYCCFNLSFEKDEVVYIPPGFAHGFLTLSETSIFSYMCTGEYDPSSCGGIFWNDPDLKIPWPVVDSEKLIITSKDSNWPTLAEYLRSGTRDE